MPTDQRVGFDDRKDIAPFEESGELGECERTESVARRGFFLHSTYSASCLRRNRFSAASAAEDRRLRQKKVRTSTEMRTTQRMNSRMRERVDIATASHKYVKSPIPSNYRVG